MHYPDSTATRSGWSRFSGADLFWAGLMLVVLGFTGSKTGIYVDDGWITLAHARNLAAGIGMVFQPGPPVLGTTTPLWCVLHGAVIWLFGANGTGPYLLVLASQLAAAISLSRLSRALGAGGFWGLAGVSWLLLPDHIALFGMEHSLAACLLAETLLAFFAGRRVLAGFLAAALCLTRPEAALLALLLAALGLLPDATGEFAARLRRVLLYAAPVAVIGVLTLGCFQVLYGSPVPHTFGGKRAQMILGAGELHWIESIGKGAIRSLWVDWIRGPLVPALLLVGGGVSLAVRVWIPSPQRALLLALPIWVVLHYTVLQLLGIPFYRWYLYPLWILAVAVLPLGLAHLAGGTEAQRFGPRSAYVVALLGGIAIAMMLPPWSGDPAAAMRDRYSGYRALAERVNADSRRPAEASLMAQEIGVIRYYLDPEVRMIDEMLLVSTSPVTGRFPTRADFMAVDPPDYLVESHPYSPHHTPQQKAGQDERLRDDFVLWYYGSNQVPYRYTIMARDKNSYGLQVLLRGESVPNP